MLKQTSRNPKCLFVTSIIAYVNGKLFPNENYVTRTKHELEKKYDFGTSFHANLSLTKMVLNPVKCCKTKVVPQDDFYAKDWEYEFVERI